MIAWDPFMFLQKFLAPQPGPVGVRCGSVILADHLDMLLQEQKDLLLPGRQLGFGGIRVIMRHVSPEIIPVQQSAEGCLEQIQLLCNKPLLRHRVGAVIGLEIQDRPGGAVGGHKRRGVIPQDDPFAVQEIIELQIPSPGTGDDALLRICCCRSLAIREVLAVNR